MLSLARVQKSQERILTEYGTSYAAINHCHHSLQAQAIHISFLDS